MYIINNITEQVDCYVGFCFTLKSQILKIFIFLLIFFFIF